MTGAFKVGSDGSVNFQEKDGLDYAPVTVQLPGGERVPFLFTVKEFTGKGNVPIAATSSSRPTVVPPSSTRRAVVVPLVTTTPLPSRRALIPKSSKRKTKRTHRLEGFRRLQRRQVRPGHR